MTNPIDNTQVTEHRVTAEQLEKSCPAELEELGKRIAAHLKKASQYQEKADQQHRAIGQYLAQAKQACDEGGFAAFREKFFPNLGQSRVYELLSIATNKKSVEEIKASTRERVAKHRAKKAAISVTVTENAASVSGAQDAGTDAADEGDATSDQSLPANPHTAVTHKNDARLRGAPGASRNDRRLIVKDELIDCIETVKRLLSASVVDSGMRQMFRRTHSPYLDGFIDEGGKCRFDPSRFMDSNPTLVPGSPQDDGVLPDRLAKAQTA